jgi:ribosome-associated toxin RatA of RatAB toxin-antitoxin module
MRQNRALRGTVGVNLIDRSVELPSFNLSLPIETSCAELWALISDVPRFAELFPYIAVEEMQAPAPGSWSFRRRLEIPNLAALCWREENRVTGERELSFQAVEGDLQCFTGRWLVSGNGGGAVLELALDYEVPDAVGAQIPEGLARYVMNELFKSVCNRVKEAAEGEAG